MEQEYPIHARNDEGDEIPRKRGNDQVEQVTRRGRCAHILRQLDVEYKKRQNDGEKAVAECV